MKHTYRCQTCRSQTRAIAAELVKFIWCYVCKATTKHVRED